jgi:hypothetical protein
MYFESKNNNRYLIKNNTEINVSDKQIVKYTGIYYNNESETKFIGIIETCKGSLKYDTNTFSIDGIFIKPLYIRLDNYWYKIINYKEPQYPNKYFNYPHLLALAESNVCYAYKPLNFLHTIENFNDDIESICFGEIEL